MIASEYASQQYQHALDAFLAGAGERALTQAYELGRQLLGNGLDLQDLAELHHRALRAWVDGRDVRDAPAAVDSAATFFAEILSSFGLHFLRIDESNAAWRRVNDSLEEEVRRISQALHSEAGNILAQAALEMDLMSKSVPDELQSQLDLVRGLLEQTGERLRHYSHELRPSMLDDFGLLQALSFLAEGVERRTGVPVRVFGSLERRLPARIELAVYRVVQEAINNALRHGGDAVKITVRVELQDDCLRCVVADDGHGFNVTEVLRGHLSASLGLLGMRERAAVLEGDCKISSRPGDGTTVELSLPL